MRLLKWLAALSIAGVALLGTVALRRSTGSTGPIETIDPELPRSSLSSILIRGVPHEAQKPDFCGEACVAMWLRKLGLPGDQDWIFSQTGVDPALGRGAYAGELAKGLTAMGFHIGDGWYRVQGGRPETQSQLDKRFAELYVDLQRGVPSIVCMHYDDTPDAPEHFRLILGYDADRDEVIYHEPAEADGSYRHMARARFLALWPLKSDAHDWTVVRFRLDGRPPGRLVDAKKTAAAQTSGRNGADYAQHILALKGRLPREFSLALSPPFVVLGDGGEDQVNLYAAQSISWAVKRLKESYFQRDPEEIIDIWLFKDGPSYERYTKLLFDEEPETPYGYYSEAHHALFMNIATGGGTLVHEIVHPYLHANFPDVPPWFNEGLGSLYEQCDERDGKIVGLTNWRLEGLQARIRSHKLPTFQSLTAADHHAFYKGAHSGTGYGQSRYLLYYLQEHGLLSDYYHRFHEAREHDPTGYATLQKVLGETDMAAFQKRWERWVLELKFEPTE